MLKRYSKVRLFCVLFGGYFVRKEVSVDLGSVGRGGSVSGLGDGGDVVEGDR